MQPQEVLMKKISTYDQAALSRLLLEISFLDSASSAITQNRPVIIT
jgi:hypothetical protein